MSRTPREKDKYLPSSTAQPEGPAAVSTKLKGARGNHPTVRRRYAPNTVDIVFILIRLVTSTYTHLLSRLYRHSHARTPTCIILVHGHKRSHIDALTDICHAVSGAIERHIQGVAEGHGIVEHKLTLANTIEVRGVPAL
ncbi:hypothetical protein V8D89_011221 [Ganoderma adspersum]